ncbi:glycosyltransferase [Achromobacter aloeverae]
MGTSSETRRGRTAAAGDPASSPPAPRAPRQRRKPPAAAAPPCPPLPEVLAALDRLVGAASGTAAALQAMEQAETLAAHYPRDAAVRLSMLRLRDRARQPALAPQWEALLADHPGDTRIVRYYVRHLARMRDHDETLRAIERHMPPAPDDPAAELIRAELLADVKEFAQADAIFQDLLRREDRREVRISYAKSLHKRGLLADAVDVLGPAVDSVTPGSKAAELVATLMDDYDFYRRREPLHALRGEDVKVIAMKHAILHFRDRDVPRPSDEPKRVALVTGNLGAGGAERQLSRLACKLRGLRASGHESTRSGRPVPCAVEVLVKQHTDADSAARGQRMDFFLGDLVEAGVRVKEINHMPPVPAARQAIEEPDLLRLLERLPPQVHYGVTRLCPYLRERKFDVVSLWQDGTCLFGALAALIAGVPVIHLVFRGLPPNIRKTRARPEYAVLYRALAEVPGVLFASNSKAAAREYAKWLDLPLARFHILYNGVPEIATDGTEDDERKWAGFEQATQGATETIGGVFRLEPDKRPLVWIRMAHRYLQKRPGARFVIVGNGRLHEQTRELAEKLGIADRLLLAGHTSRVGFWYARMNVKVLLSGFEGLPNVLIEAQALGVCTVSTPAGGAGECFIDGVTGHLLKSAEHPDLEDACEKIASLAGKAREDPTLIELGRQHARSLFSVEAMIDAFIGLCMVDVHEGANEESSTRPIAAAA